MLGTGWFGALAAQAGPGIKELTDGLGAHSVIEAAGTQESMLQAIRARPGGHVGAEAYAAMDERRAIKVLLRP